MSGDTVLEARREPADLRPRLVLGVGLGTLGFLGVVLGLVWLFQAWVGPQERAFAAPTAFPAPRLQSDPAGDLRDYQAAQRAKLEGYAWADRNRGLVRIPVDRAMAMIAAKGAEAYAPLDPPRGPEPQRR